MSEADRRPITQVTSPEIVHEFIGEMPGLRETCLRNPSFLGPYAPQLLVPGLGGEFESIFDDCSRRSIRMGGMVTRSHYTEEISPIRTPRFSPVPSCRAS